MGSELSGTRYTMSERTSCLLLPPLLPGPREHSNPYPVLHSHPQTQVPSDGPGPPGLSPGPRGSSVPLRRGARACQELTQKQNSQVVRTPARWAPHNFQGRYLHRNVTTFP